MCEDVGNCAGEPVAFICGVGAAPLVLDRDGEDGPVEEGVPDSEVEVALEVFCESVSELHRVAVAFTSAA